ncbi:DUF397 domain-containing protein [Spirillospora sp. NPDC047279]|uniref:DUF397 domain-containing protein n=1 Tax=Spirillospora sp. NPDC047279 TaxID=3155478 RepID=UPI0033BFBD6B
MTIGGVVVMIEPAGIPIKRVGYMRSAAGVIQEVAWHKASASASSGCVEVAAIGTAIFVQDSKNPDGGPVINLSARAWAGLLDAIRHRQP